LTRTLANSLGSGFYGGFGTRVSITGLLVGQGVLIWWELGLGDFNSSFRLRYLASVFSAGATGLLARSPNGVPGANLPLLRGSLCLMSAGGRTCANFWGESDLGMLGGTSIFIHFKPETGVMGPPKRSAGDATFRSRLYGVCLYRKLALEIEVVFIGRWFLTASLTY
jgi:hypothetical protein